MRWIVTLATLLLILAFSVGSTTASTKKMSAESEIEKCKHARKAVGYYRQVTHRWQRRRQSRHLAKGFRVRGRHCDYARRAAKVWQARAVSSRKTHKRWVKEQIRIRKDQATRRARRLYEKWECIHEHEGAWNDPNGPYYGGLQMDLGFQRAYGPEFVRRYGTADRWPVWAQIEAAERAWRVRGFSPWPNTARMCGLL